MKKRILSSLLVSMIIFLFTACAEGGIGTLQERNENDETDVANAVSNAEEDQRREGTDSHILVAYFSMTGEQYVVGNIEKGNTQIIAEIIARQTGADLFQIQPVTPYPNTYEELLEVSQQESPENPPEIADTVENMEQYDTLFIGSPVWWGDLPAIVSGFHSCEILPDVVQVECHPYYPQDDLRKFLSRRGMILQAWFPLGHGDKSLLKQPVFARLSEKYGKTVGQVILRWHIQMGNVVIPGARSKAHIEENIRIFDFTLTDEEMDEIAELNRHVPFVTHKEEDMDRYLHWELNIDGQE